METKIKELTISMTKEREKIYQTVKDNFEGLHTKLIEAREKIRSLEEADIKQKEQIQTLENDNKDLLQENSELKQTLVQISENFGETEFSDEEVDETETELIKSSETPDVPAQRKLPIEPTQTKTSLSTSVIERSTKAPMPMTTSNRGPENLKKPETALLEGETASTSNYRSPDVTRRACPPRMKTAAAPVRPHSSTMTQGSPERQQHRANSPTSNRPSERSQLARPKKPPHKPKRYFPTQRSSGTGAADQRSDDFLIATPKRANGPNQLPRAGRGYEIGNRAKDKPS